MKITWVAATGNPGKLREFRTIFHNYGLRIISRDEAGITGEPEETGITFEENALIKARACAEESGLPSFSDDSGIMVDALDGAPGIYSARYAPPGEEVAKLLRAMEHIPDGRRGGAFYCAVACVIPDVCEFTVSGECRGIITREPAGSGGFGYDPIFFSPEYGMTFAELPAEIKNKISHRAAALAALRERLVEMRLINADK